MKYFIANWKANKSLSELNDWADSFSQEIKSNNIILEQITNCVKKIIICPPTPFLLPLKEKLSSIPSIVLGVQNISPFEAGPYTGEVTATNIADFATYVIVNHSERKKHNHETSADSFRKSIQAKKKGLKTIYCIESKIEQFPTDSDLVCYEPLDAISSGSGIGNNISSDRIIEFRKSLSISQEAQFIYGGSVNEQNISTYLQSNQIDGFLIGGASLDPKRFFTLISQ